MDISHTIIPKSDQINADDLIAGVMTITITSITRTGEEEQPVSVHFQGDNGKPYKPCKSMRRVMVLGWGVNARTYVGRRLTLYRDESVKWGGQPVGGIRISHMSHIEKPMTIALTATRSLRKPHTVHPLPTLAGEPEAPPAEPETVADGQDAASKGVAAYTGWLAELDADTKATIRRYHAEWSAMAKKVNFEGEENGISQ